MVGLLIFCYIVLPVIFPSNDDCSDFLKSIEITSNVHYIKEEGSGLGFDGDGDIYREYYFDDYELNSILKQVDNNSHWHKGLVDDELYELINFGGITHDLINKDCYYYFHDNYKYYLYEGNLYDYKEFNSGKKRKHRNVNNYIVAILDVQSNFLYVYYTAV